MTRDGLASALVMASINNLIEEREAYFDAFSTCETYLREEAAQAAQLFEDLARLPNDLALCEPLQMDVRGEVAAGKRFYCILERIGVFSAAELVEETRIELDTCTRVFSNPLHCDGRERAAVMQALEDSPRIDVWATEYENGASIGEALAAWTRESFNTPFQFWRQAEECELKCHLIGIVSALTNEELSNLLYSPSLESVIKSAAATARR